MSLPVRGQRSGLHVIDAVRPRRAEPTLATETPGSRKTSPCRSHATASWGRIFFRAIRGPVAKGAGAGAAGLAGLAGFAWAARAGAGGAARRAGDRDSRRGPAAESRCPPVRHVTGGISRRLGGPVMAPGRSPVGAFLLPGRACLTGYTGWGRGAAPTAGCSRWGRTVPRECATVPYLGCRWGG
jgi:hypothetical protein